MQSTSCPSASITCHSPHRPCATYMGHEQCSGDILLFFPVMLGFIAYITALTNALLYRHSPFQTSVSAAIGLVYGYAVKFVSSDRPIIVQRRSNALRTTLV
ncbi:hypothetical protein FRC03_004765 [Tulasnella sp. 419]|nr:hypothetical protein FRC03_004765 [Tulasnella sp. 419]